MKRFFSKPKGVSLLAAFVSILILSAAFAFAELQDWKGMEMGLSPRPKWLFSYIENGSEKAARKKFEVPAANALVLGVGKSDDLEKARSVSQLDAQKKASAASNISFLYEYWEFDEDDIYTVYSLYQSKK